MSIKSATIVGLAVVGALVATFASWAWWSSSATHTAAATPSVRESSVGEVGERAPEPPLGPIAARDAAPVDEEDIDPVVARHPFLVRVMDHFAAPLADVAVRVRFESESGGRVGEWMRATTNADGECRFDLAKSSGAPASWLAVSEEPPLGYRADRVRVPVRVELAELVLVRTGQLSGRVSFTSGARVEPGTKLRVSWVLTPSVAGEVSTAVVDGRYSFESGPVGRIDRVALERGGKSIRELNVGFDVITVAGGGQTFHDFEFP